MPCMPKRARQLLSKKKAAVFKVYPFTIILLNREGGDTQEAELKIDPGSKITGIALVAFYKKGRKVFFAANLHHRGLAIKNALDSRRAIRRGRRPRTTRYRKPRFNNRTRKEGWLPPSIKSRVDNVLSIATRLKNLTLLSSVCVETVRFDTQKIQDPEISGASYQKGTLYGYEVREYLLEKWGRSCVYCNAQNLRLEIDHISPKSKGGSDRVSNLTICCRACNEKKANKPIETFLKEKPNILAKILKHSKRPLRDTAAVNATRYAIGNVLKTLGLSTSFSTGGKTKYNRTCQGYKKDHWTDAACVGDTGQNVDLSEILSILKITAKGRGRRQKCLPDQYGFPRTKAKKSKIVKGFQTGDIVKAIVLKGKKTGTYFGRVAVRSSGNFNIRTNLQTVQGINAKYCEKRHFADGYEYSQEKVAAFPPRPKDRSLHAVL